MSGKTDLKKLSVSAMLCAMAFLMTFLFRFKVSFLTFDLKDAIISVSALLYGPIYGVASALAVAVLEFLSVSDTGVYGLIMNALSSCTFALVCGTVYKYKRTFSGAVLGVVFSVFAVTGIMLIANIFITPFYMGVERGDVIKLIPTLLLPFNLCKAVINASSTMLIYKPVTTALRRMGVLSGENKRTFNMKTVVITAVSVIVIIVAVLFIILYMNGAFELF